MKHLLLVLALAVVSGQNLCATRSQEASYRGTDNNEESVWPTVLAALKSWSSDLRF